MISSFGGGTGSGGGGPGRFVTFVGGVCGARDEAGLRGVVLGLPFDEAPAVRGVVLLARGARGAGLSFDPSARGALGAVRGGLGDGSARGLSAPSSTLDPSGSSAGDS
jgi:hypothetical protein